MALALLDTNVLVHATQRNAPLFAIAAGLVQRALRQGGLYCIAPQNLVEFSAVVSRPRLVSTPIAGPEVLRMCELLYSSRRLAKIYPNRGTVIRTMREGSVLGVTGPRWYDLFLAVTMRDCGVHQIITEDIRDFSGIPFVSPMSLRDAA